METNIQKWGNSLGIRLPKQIADKRSFKEGGRVRISETKEGIMLEVIQSPRPSLKGLLKGITKENLHREVDWGGHVGNEVW